MSDKKAGPDTTSLAYSAMKPAWDKVQTVLDGTGAMRASGQAYLPQHHGEVDASYKERLDRATLLNITKLTLNSWVGRPFSDPIQYEDVPPAINDLLADVDLMGNDSQVFCRDWFWDGLAKAYSHVYVDFPRTDTGAVRTLADDEAENVRPYWVHIKPEQLFFASAEVIDGRETLREIRIKEEVVIQQGFAEVVVDQIRRVFMTEEGGFVELYRLDPADKKKETWIIDDSYPFSLPFIPLVTFYAHRDSFMRGVPPLLDLADLNIAHWQSTSDQRAILTVTRFPILALSGAADEGKEIIIGPHQWMYSPDPKGKFYYVEHSGDAIEAGRKDLLDLEEQMSEYGADFLRKRPGNTTATARALDSAEATSPLKDMVIRFSEALDQVLKYTAEWLKLSEGGTSTLSTDFGPEEVNQAELATLAKTRETRDISRTAFLKELQRRGLLDDEYDIEKDGELIEKETLDLFGTLVPPVEEEEDEQKQKGETEEGEET